MWTTTMLTASTNIVQTIVCMITILLPLTTTSQSTRQTTWLWRLTIFGPNWARTHRQQHSHLHDPTLIPHRSTTSSGAPLYQQLHRRRHPHNIAVLQEAASIGLRKKARLRRHHQAFTQKMTGSSNLPLLLLPLRTHGLEMRGQQRVQPVGRVPSLHRQQLPSLRQSKGRQQVTLLLQCLPLLERLPTKLERQAMREG